MVQLKGNTMNKIQKSVWDLVSNSLEDSVLKSVRSRVEYSVRNNVWELVSQSVNVSINETQLIYKSIRSKYE